MNVWYIFVAIGTFNHLFKNSLKNLRKGKNDSLQDSKKLILNRVPTC